ncbi:hypothetical protein [Catellatospora chokoriensis]|uniref:Uncharacterized protein n=1 Tax=Catellatospora chokoriensis TaxID=310353 RepID=A0A8J3KFK7_9ACTN|nr:hypothetical protein [Catellatospora chokoriensis]GIF94134.1 hypothetical protein Cch02nite_75780 [Catellatospora chokoriensis]
MTQPSAGEPPVAPTSDRLLPLLKVATEVGSLAALLTALLYYFGWARSEAQARAFGADASVFDMSTADYLLRSIDALFIPVFLLLVASYLGIRVHRRLTGSHRVGSVREGGPEPVPSTPPRSAIRWARWLRLSWLIPVAIGIPLTMIVPVFGHITFPLWVAVGIVGTAYGATLHRVFQGRPLPSLTTVALVAALLAVTLFWTAERYATFVGGEMAVGIKAAPADELAPVAVYSVRRLNLSTDRVRETITPGPEPGYGYRYDGLFLLQRSGDKYFLLSDGWNDGLGRLIVLPDNDSIRLEFGG